jgi:hypothetical protein
MTDADSGAGFMRAALASIREGSLIILTRVLYFGFQNPAYAGKMPDLHNLCDIILQSVNFSA